MNATTNLIFTIAGAAMTLLTVYGAITLNRKLFLSGLCYFSFLPIIGESMAYNADKMPVHIIVLLVFVAQFILALPNKIVYGPENVAAGKLASKIALGLLVFNIGGAVFILCLKANVPVQFGYYHVVFCLAIIYLLISKMTSNAWLK